MGVQGGRGPKWCYVLPEYDLSAAHHFSHVAPLLSRLAEKTRLTVVVERARGQVEIPGADRVIVQRHRFGPARLFELFTILWRLSALGYKTVFVRISTPASLMAALVRRLRGGRVLVWRSGQGKQFNPGWGLTRRALTSKFLIELPFLVILRMIDFLVTGPETMVDYFVTEWRVDRRKVRLLYNDIDLSRFGPVSDPEIVEGWRSNLMLEPDDKVVLAVARFSPIRRMDLYIPEVVVRTLEVHPEAVFVFVGDGLDSQKLHQLVDEAGVSDRVRWTGAVPQADTAALYSLADFFWLPSFTEGFPRVLIEAMAFGLPLALTDAGGVIDIVGPEQRPFVVDRGDPRALAEALIRILAEPDLAATLGGANLERVRRYDVNVVAEMYLDVLFGDGA